MLIEIIAPQTNPRYKSLPRFVKRPLIIPYQKQISKPIFTQPERGSLMSSTSESEENTGKESRMQRSFSIIHISFKRPEKAAVAGRSRALTTSTYMRAPHTVSAVDVRHSINSQRLAKC